MKRLPKVSEIQQFGANGEEAILRLLQGKFDCILQNVVVPHKDGYLEKDLLVVEKGVPFVLEIKNWKGRIGKDGNKFFQEKKDGTRKELKSPVGTTEQFIKRMKEYYAVECPIFGVVVFAEPEATLDLPEEEDEIALLTADKLVSYIRSKAKHNPVKPGDFEPACILRCTRLYNGDREFCKGILVNPQLECRAKDGAEVSLDTTQIKYITVKKRPLFLGYKLFVTFSNNATGVFKSKNQTLVVGCLDGSFTKFSLGKIQYLVF